MLCFPCFMSFGWFVPSNAIRNDLVNLLYTHIDTFTKLLFASNTPMNISAVQLFVSFKKLHKTQNYSNPLYQHAVLVLSIDIHTYARMPSLPSTPYTANSKTLFLTRQNSCTHSSLRNQIRPASGTHLSSWRIAPCPKLWNTSWAYMTRYRL